MDGRSLSNSHLEVSVELSHSFDQLFAAIHTVLALLSSPPSMLLFATPVECNGCIYHLPAHRAEMYRSIRAPVVHVGAGDPSPCQLVSLDSGPAREIRRILRMTVELCGFTSRVSVAPGNLQLPSRLVVLEQFTDPAESRVQT